MKIFVLLDEMHIIEDVLIEDVLNDYSVMCVHNMSRVYFLVHEHLDFR